MRLLIDANILLDVLAARQPYLHDSAAIWKLCETKRAEGYVSALTFANLVYVMRKELDPEQIETVLRSLSLIFSFIDLKETDLKTAASLKWDDFEDAVQFTSADRISADCIVTRNIREFKKSSIPAFTPSELLSRI